MSDLDLDAIKARADEAQGSTRAAVRSSADVPALLARIAELEPLAAVTGLDLAAIKARADAATPGPWDIWRDLDAQGFYTVGEASGVIPEGEVWVDGEHNPTAHVYVIADAEFIAHARTDVPALLARIAELEAERRGYERALLDAAKEPTP